MFKFLERIHNSIVRRDRILALDLLRGTFLLVIITSHSIWSPSLLTFIGGGGHLFASAAEGFFVISGMLVGFIYGPRVLKDTRKVFIKTWRRAGYLYLLAVFFTFFYTAWATLLPESIKYTTLPQIDGMSFIINTLLLQNTFGWTDFLILYAVFMFYAPFVVWLIAKKQTVAVALLSVFVWWFFRDTNFISPFTAWQVVFMFGIIIGYYLPNIESYYSSFSRKTKKRILAIVWGGALVSFIISVIWIIAIPYVTEHNPTLANTPIIEFLNKAHSALLPYTEKANLDPVRIALGTLWFSALYSFFRIHEKKIHKSTRGILDTFGKNSLFVYGLHGFVLFFVDLYLRPPEHSSILTNTVVTVFIIIVIYMLTKKRGVFTKIRKKLLPSFSREVIP